MGGGVAAVLAICRLNSAKSDLLGKLLSKTLEILAPTNHHGSVCLIAISCG